MNRLHAKQQSGMNRVWEKELFGMNRVQEAVPSEANGLHDKRPSETLTTEYQVSKNKTSQGKVLKTFCALYYSALGFHGWSDNAEYLLLLWLCWVFGLLLALLVLVCCCCGPVGTGQNFTLVCQWTSRLCFMTYCFWCDIKYHAMSLFCYIFPSWAGIFLCEAKFDPEKCIVLTPAEQSSHKSRI